MSIVFDLSFAQILSDGRCSRISAAASASFRQENQAIAARRGAMERPAAPGRKTSGMEKTMPDNFSGIANQA
ncbi:hypothetical protein [Parvibaculum sp.]|uniref:hypothetical protein n=1 Tax=Parvibaculum sp. TaxID=2024848 RepID=UPI002CFC94C3|nr:hypothetical protein [Parvibaculum sp.]HUD50983.1 hypothetical protein [Parvibaculum sp.]